MSQNIEWATSPHAFRRTPRTAARVRRNVDRLWVTWMVDQLTRELRREVGLPSRFVERATSRRMS